MRATSSFLIFLWCIATAFPKTNQSARQLSFAGKSAPEGYFEFHYQPAKDPNFNNRTQVRSVSLAGSFNGWNPAANPMTDRGDGIYTTSLRLDAGFHQYKFVVNGNIWLQDPNADPTLRVDDGHGGFNSGLYIGEQGKDFGPARTNDINLAAARHDPSQPAFFNVVAKDLVELKLRTLQNDVPSVALNLWLREKNRVAMRKSDTSFGFDYWTASIETTNRTLRYSFSLNDGTASQTFGPFEVPVIVKFATPDWAKHVVWYQIFPERFRNGMTRNDPPHTLPWRWDWYKFAPWETPNESKTFSGEWYNRRLGGDLQGVIEKLPYLRELGVTGIYFCPVFEADSNHGYDTVDYRHINRHFGFTNDTTSGGATARGETLYPVTWQWTASDKLFLEFIKRAHSEGIKVIIDGVFNHMGKGSFAMQDLLTNGVNSVYADWFDVIDWGPPIKYKSWDNGGWLPNFKKDPEKGYASASAKKYILDVTRRWMAPDGNPLNGVDGWRLDVAEDVPAAFWREWRGHVKSVNPNAYITGEAWGVVQKHLQGDEWDASMNYPFAMRAVSFFIDKKRKISATEFDRRLRELLATYPMQVDLVMQNLYDSHDTDRLANMISNPDRNYDGCNRPQDGCPYNGSKPGPDAYRVLNLMATFQMTFLGAPMIWYGDEVGMFGADDPTNRKPMLWKDLEPYDNRQEAVMPDLLAHYQRLIAIRNTYPALRVGSYEANFVDDARDIFSFVRAQHDQSVAIVLNNSDKDASIEVPVPFPNDTRVVDLLNVPARFDYAPMSAVGFPQFGTNATVQVLRISANAAPIYTVRQGKIKIALTKKSAAILAQH